MPGIVDRMELRKVPTEDDDSMASLNDDCDTIDGDKATITSRSAGNTILPVMSNVTWVKKGGVDGDVICTISSSSFQSIFG